MTEKKALVTILIGDDYIAMWERLFAQTWREYCKRHGYDLVVIKDYIDKSDRAFSRGPHWQKCLILEHEEVRKYDRVVWVDADVAINFHNAPCIVEATPRDLIGAMHYNDMNCMTPKLVATRQQRFYAARRISGLPEPEMTAARIYELCGYPEPIDDRINTGVLVLTPEIHADFLRYVYDNYEESEHSLYDNHPISYELLKRGLSHRLDSRFNADYLYDVLEMAPYMLLPAYKVQTKENRMMRILVATVIWNNNYFIHCTSGVFNCREEMGWVLKERPEWENYAFELQ